MRPGNIYTNFTPKKLKSFGNYSGRALAGFGKGAMLPPPVPPGPGEWGGSGWSCPGNKPLDEPDGSYVCCPSGWVKVLYGDTNTCSDEHDLYECGPLPAEASPLDFSCVRGHWVPAQAAMPLPPDQILAPDIVMPPSTSVDPRVIAIIGGGVALLFVTTLAWKMLS